MTESHAIEGIRQAAKERDEAAMLRAKANSQLREWARRAQAEGVSITRIAQEAHLSRQGLYDLLADPQSV